MICFSLLITFILSLVLILLIRPFQFDGSKNDGSFGLFNLSTSSSIAKENNNLLGTDSYGRDNLTLFAAGWINQIIFLLSVLAFSIVIAIPLSYVLQNTIKGLNAAGKTRRYEWVIILPTSMIIAALFMDHSFIFFIAASAIPGAISFAHEISLQRRTLKSINYKMSGFAGTLGWKHNIFFQELRIFFRSFFTSLIRSSIFLIFWEFQFSYLGLINTDSVLLIGSKNTMGWIAFESVIQILYNPEMAITVVLSVIGVLISFSMINAPNQPEEKITVWDKFYKW